MINENEFKPKKISPRKNKERTKAKIHSKLAMKYQVTDLVGLKLACSSCDHGPGFHKCCPNCGITANGAAEIEVIFGYRKMTVDSDVAIPQSRCRDCR